MFVKCFKLCFKTQNQMISSLHGDVLKELCSHLGLDALWEFHTTCKHVYQVVQTHFSKRIKVISIIRRDTFFYNEDAKHEDEYKEAIKEYEDTFSSEFLWTTLTNYIPHASPLKVCYSFYGPRIDNFDKFASQFVKLLGKECKTLGLKMLTLKIRSSPKTQFYFCSLSDHDYDSRFPKGDNRRYLGSFYRYTRINSASIFYDRADGTWLVSHVYDIQILYEVVIRMMKLVKQMNLAVETQFTTPKLTNQIVVFKIRRWSQRWRQPHHFRDFWIHVKSQILSMQEFSVSNPITNPTSTIIPRSDAVKNVNFHDTTQNLHIAKLYYSFDSIQLLTQNFTNYSKIITQVLQVMDTVSFEF